MTDSWSEDWALMFRLIERTVAHVGRTNDLPRGEIEELEHYVAARIEKTVRDFDHTGDAPIEACLTKLIKFRCIDFLRRYRYRIDDPELVELAADPDAPAPIDSAARSEIASFLAECLAELEEVHRQLLRRVHVLGRRISQVAEEDDEPRSTISKRLTRLRGTVRACLERKGMYGPGASPEPDHRTDAPALAARDVGVATERDVRDHIGGCSDCAGLYFRFCRLQEAARAAPEPRRRDWRRMLLAASVLLAASGGVAVGRMLVTPPPLDLLDSRDWVSVASWSKAGYEFKSLDFAPTASIETSLTFALDETDRGRLFVVKEEGIQLCAFDRSGRALWSTGWVDDWRSNLGGAETFLGAKLLHTRKIGSRFEESVVVVGSAGMRNCVMIVDPTTGAHARPVFFEGQFWWKEGQPIQVLPPEESGRRRPVIVGGAHKQGESAEPCALLFGPDGELVQQIYFPVLKKGYAEHVHITEIRANWRTEPVTVEFDTSEDLTFYVPYVGGQLQAGGAWVGNVDNLYETMRRDFGDENANEIIGAYGGKELWQERLKKDVSTTSRELPKGWGE